MNRRDLLLAMGALGLAPLACSKGDTVSNNRQLERIGIQLYTVRDRMAEDVPATLGRLAEIGYKEVEFAGYFDHSPAEIRSILDDLGLRSPSAHTLLQPMRDEPDAIIEAAATVGHDYLVIGWLTPEERASLDNYRAHIDVINTFAEKCHAAGLKLAYHNHDFEFVELEGIRPIDLLLAETDAATMEMELDLYWITKAGADPFAFFGAHAGRIPLCHVKDMDAAGSFADVGAGTIDFAAIFAEIDKAGLRHFYVERDDAVDGDSLASAANSFAGASAISF